MRKEPSNKPSHVVIFRALTDNSPLSGAATFLVEGIKIGTYEGGGVLFLSGAINGEGVAETNSNSHAYGLHRGSEENAVIDYGPTYDDAVQQQFSPLQLMGKYLQKPYQEFGHNETTTSDKPFAFCCSSQYAEELRSKFPELKDLPIINYDSKSGTFSQLDGNGSKKEYHFPDHVLSALNPHHRQLATQAYELCLTVKAEEERQHLEARNRNFSSPSFYRPDPDFDRPSGTIKHSESLPSRLDKDHEYGSGGGYDGYNGVE